MSSYTVICDACVLYPAHLRDVLIELASRGIYRARWTDLIHDEWIRSVLEDRPDISPQRLATTRELMNARVLDSLVTDFERLIPAIELPDPADRHVVAAALKARADSIVTINVRHFPQDVLDRYEIEALTPDEFLTRQFDLSPAAVCAGVRSIRERLRKPPYDPMGLIGIYESRRLPKFAERLRSKVDAI